MNNISGKDFLKTLKCLDIETGNVTGESLDWLFDKKDPNDILYWLCTYVNENNVETCNEIQDYTVLVNEGRNLSIDFIDNRCKSYPILDDICNVNTYQINSLRREVEAAKIKAENINKLTSKYLFLEGKLNRNIEDEEMNSRIKRHSFLSTCLQYGKQVDELHNSFYERVETFSDILSNYNTIQEKYFISQMPIDTYKQQCEMFQTNLHLWIRKKFEISNFNYQKDDIDNIDSQLNSLYFIIRESIVKHFQSECNQKEIAAKLNYLRNNTYTEMTFEHRRVQEIQYTSRINILNNEIETLYATDLQQTAEKYTENLINLVLIKNAENKLNKCRNIIKTLRNLNSEVIKALAQYELLFLLFKTDKVKLRDIEKFLEDLYFYSSNYLKNYSLRSQLLKEVEYNVANQECAFNEILSSLTENYRNEPVNIKLFISEVEKQKVAIENLENDLFIIRNQKYLNEVKQMEQNITDSKKIVWCGPTLQPVIIPYEYLENSSIANCQIDKLTKALKTNLDNYQQTRASMKNDIWGTCRRLIWVWFLMQPEKIPVVIEQLKDFVTEQVKSNT